MSVFTRSVPIVLSLALALLIVQRPAEGQTVDKLRQNTLGVPAPLEVGQGERVWANYNRNDAYPEGGITIGFPALLNIEAGYWLGSVGIRLSGMYWGKSYGVQGNLGYKVSETRQRYHAVALVLGRGVGDEPEQDCCDWTYLGGAYNLTYRGFFLEAGLETPVKVRRGNFRKVLPLLQIGYMHRFLPE